MQHDRQLLHWGIEKQRKISGAKVGIYGSSSFAQYLAAGLAGLGIGNLLLASNSTKTISASPFPLQDKSSLVHQVSSYASKIWQGGSYFPVHSSPHALLSCFGLDVLVSTEEYHACKNLGIPVMSATYKPLGPISSCVTAGLMLEQLVRRLFGDAFSPIVETYRPYSGECKGSYLVVGCGALGNFCAWTLALMGAKRIDLVDPDRIEQTNLNRQVLLYDRIGEHKASVLRDRLKELHPTLESRVSCFKFQESCINGVYDGIFSCVDTISGRKMISDASDKYKMPLINGGTTATEGSIYTYIPGKTRTIREQCSLDLLKDQDAQSCQQAQPSVIIPNMIIGSLMVDALLRAQKGEVKNGYYGVKGVSWR